MDFGSDILQHDVLQAIEAYFLRHEKDGDNLEPRIVRKQYLLHCYGASISPGTYVPGKTLTTPPILASPNPHWAIIGNGKFGSIYNTIPINRLGPLSLTDQQNRECDEIMAHLKRGLTMGSNESFGHAIRGVVNIRNFKMWTTVGTLPVDRERNPNESRLHVLRCHRRTKDIIGKACAGKPLKPGNLSFARWIFMGVQMDYIRSTYLERKYEKFTNEGPHTDLKYPKNEPELVALMEQEMLEYIVQIGILPGGTVRETGASDKLWGPEKVTYPPIQLEPYLWRKPSWGEPNVSPVDDHVPISADSNRDWEFHDAVSEEDEEEKDMLDGDHNTTFQLVIPAQYHSRALDKTPETNQAGPNPNKPSGAHNPVSTSYKPTEINKTNNPNKLIDPDFTMQSRQQPPEEPPRSNRSKQNLVTPFKEKHTGKFDDLIKRSPKPRGRSGLEWANPDDMNAQKRNYQDVISSFRNRPGQDYKHSVNQDKAVQVATDAIYNVMASPRNVFWDGASYMTSLRDGNNRANEKR